ncbi:hypothetical protein GCM10010448_47740 [Streptomyces glomeratus]|uniref:Uncharacterized protein n=1 Tax=Streptomyces glomeratus TaxID=284452 RepID=A0ABP6LWZ9_9ACTN
MHTDGNPGYSRQFADAWGHGAGEAKARRFWAESTVTGVLYLIGGPVRIVTTRTRPFTV